MKPELNSKIKETDARLIPHVKHAILRANKKIVVSSTEIVVFSLHTDLLT